MRLPWAKSPAHKFGEAIGNYCEASIEPLLKQIAENHGLYLDKKVLGRLEVGEISVAVAVSCPHRAEAFEACRHAIDRLKELVPIWKKENWAGGSTEWVYPSDNR